MPYTIQYSPEMTQKYPAIKGHKPFKWGRGLCAILVIGGAVWVHLKGLPDFMIPGDPEITKSAAAMMLSNLRNGASIHDAVTVFCKEILNGALY